MRRCKLSNVIPRAHDDAREVPVAFCKAAGLVVAREPDGLLRDNSAERPGDLFNHGRNAPGITHTKHALGFAAPLSGSCWSQLPEVEKTARASTTGVAGTAAE